MATLLLRQQYPPKLLYTCIIKYKTSDQVSREGFSNFSKYKHHAPLLIHGFFKIILWLFQYYNSSLHCDPIISPGIKTFLNYTYLRMIPYVSAFLANKMVFKKNIFFKYHHILYESSLSISERGRDLSF